MIIRKNNRDGFTTHAIALAPAFWIPAFAGMTEWGAGMTEWGAGMTGAEAEMTEL
jgi:hypothetical protein